MALRTLIPGGRLEVRLRFFRPDSFSTSEVNATANEIDCSARKVKFLQTTHQSATDGHFQTRNTHVHPREAQTELLNHSSRDLTRNISSVGLIGVKFCVDPRRVSYSRKARISSRAAGRNDGEACALIYNIPVSNASVKVIRVVLNQTQRIKP